jgi:hypothetical protein
MNETTQMPKDICPMRAARATHGGSLDAKDARTSIAAEKMENCSKKLPQLS